MHVNAKATLDVSTVVRDNDNPREKEITFFVRGSKLLEMLLLRMRIRPNKLLSLELTKELLL